MEAIPACRQAGRLQTSPQCICSSSEVQVVVQGREPQCWGGGPVLTCPHLLAAWALRLGSTGSLSPALVPPHGGQLLPTPTLGSSACRGGN